MKSAFNRSILALAAVLVVAGVSQASAQQKALKKYESGTKHYFGRFFGLVSLSGFPNRFFNDS
jgi:hypothetical protein